MEKPQPPMWAKIIASIIAATILILILAIVIGGLVNLVVAVWT